MSLFVRGVRRSPDGKDGKLYRVKGTATGEEADHVLEADEWSPPVSDQGDLGSIARSAA